MQFERRGFPGLQPWSTGFPRVLLVRLALSSRHQLLCRALLSAQHSGLSTSGPPPVFCRLPPFAFRLPSPTPHSFLLTPYFSLFPPALRFTSSVAFRLPSLSPPASRVAPPLRPQRRRIRNGSWNIYSPATVIEKDSRYLFYVGVPETVSGCIQDPSATGGETHARGYASSRSFGADR
jgi:hypothetical protein